MQVFLISSICPSWRKLPMEEVSVWWQWPGILVPVNPFLFRSCKGQLVNPLSTQLYGFLPWPLGLFKPLQIAQGEGEFGMLFPTSTAFQGPRQKPSKNFLWTEGSQPNFPLTFLWFFAVLQAGGWQVWSLCGLCLPSLPLHLLCSNHNRATVSTLSSLCSHLLPSSIPAYFSLFFSWKFRTPRRREKSLNNSCSSDAWCLLFSPISSAD